MLPKANQNENKPKDPIVQEEVRVENNGTQPIGNKGVQDVPPLNPGIGNEAMNAQIVNQALNIINDQEQEQAPKRISIMTRWNRSRSSIRILRRNRNRHRSRR